MILRFKLGGGGEIPLAPVRMLEGGLALSRAAKLCHVDRKICEVAALACGFYLIPLYKVAMERYYLKTI